MLPSSIGLLGTCTPEPQKQIFGSGGCPPGVLEWAVLEGMLTGNWSCLTGTIFLCPLFLLNSNTAPVHQHKDCEFKQLTFY